MSLDRLTANRLILNLKDMTTFILAQEETEERENLLRNAYTSVMLVSKEIPFEELEPKAQVFTQQVIELIRLEGMVD